MRGYSVLLGMLLVLIALPVRASDLTAQLTRFFQVRDPQHAAGMKVVVRTPEAQWPACEAPRFTLPGNSRLWGNLSVAANCGENRRYLQVQVQVTGNYLVATHALTRGSSVTASDFRLQSGRLDTLPARALFNSNGLNDAVVLRDILPGQPVTLSMLRQPWRVKAGQKVVVIASGDGFNASGAGQALNNAAASQWVRVRMGNGQVVSGRVDDDGNILITL
ncbi:flagellar basal body P-ring formation chaperone FlgA [[Erwinia] mediterraneensis]|uniref:flagellar basal body P-ring formation chaperone FlgA n=1 Tax=[Erwinia] mediterraneensis TaxID=2161819 RepID=UPI0010326E5F|nr:flagellar basal body P-ring formation chaperone FlgA [[Erwinia] mediterraneensis]